MMNIFLVLMMFLLTGCPKTPLVVSPPPPAPLSKPIFEKSFGEIIYGGLSTMLIRYKNISVLLDPVFEPAGSLGNFQRTEAPALTLETAGSADYLLLTDHERHHWGISAAQGLRKNLKILAPPPTAAVLQKSGFVQAKGLSKGQRVLLKKDDDFLFVSAVQSRNPVSQAVVNGYLLEFDNGKNLLITGEIVDEAVVRELVYSLRDDGKELTYVFLYGGGWRSSTDKMLQSCDENLLAVFMGLLQPRVGIILQTKGLSAASLDPSKLKTKLADEMFSGDFYFPAVGESIPF